MAKHNPLVSQYVKDIEDANNKLDTENYKLQLENDKLKKILKQMSGANDELSACLGVILERYSRDPDIKGLIEKSLLSVASKMSKEKF